jgi:hypothetical protein
MKRAVGTLILISLSLGVVWVLRTRPAAALPTLLTQNILGDDQKPLALQFVLTNVTSDHFLVRVSSALRSEITNLVVLPKDVLEFRVQLMTPTESETIVVLCSGEASDTRSDRFSALLESFNLKRKRVVVYSGKEQAFVLRAPPARTLDSGTNE